MSLFTDIIGNIKQKYAPDSRIALFDIKVYLENSVLVLRGCTNLPDAYKELFFRVHESYSAMYFNEVELLPDLSARLYVAALVNVSVANLRTEPRHAAELASQAMLGCNLILLQYERGWWRVQTPDRYIAWVEEASITLLDKIQYEVWQQQEKWLVCHEYTWAWELPDASSQRVGDLVRGNILALAGNDAYGLYKQVYYPDGTRSFVLTEEGLIYADWQRNLKPLADNIISEAFAYKGVPYLWGGTSPKAMDCSGFVKIVFAMNGISLPRDASQQVNCGIEVAPENLQMADLLFFSDRADKRITHVAIYIKNGLYIHAAGKVKVNSFIVDNALYDKFRHDTFICAKRILV